MKPLRLLLAIVALAFCGDLVAKTPTSKDKKDKADSKKFPSFDTVTRTVQKQLATNRGYRSGDLITVSVAESMVSQTGKSTGRWPTAEKAIPQAGPLRQRDWMVSASFLRQGTRVYA